MGTDFNMEATHDPYRNRRARVIQEWNEDGSQVLSAPVCVVGGPFMNEMGEPHWLVVEAKEEAVPRIVRAVRFE